MATETLTSVDSGTNRATVAVVNPATETVIDSVPAASPADVDAAVTKARAAQPAWWRLSNLEKARIFHGWADLIREAQRPLAELLSREGGKPLCENLDEVRWVYEAIEFYGEMGRAARGSMVPSQEPTLTNFVVKEPLGVVAAIVPWNYPALLAIWKVAPALVVGNTAVVKPPPEAPLTLMRIVELGYQAGLPEDVLEVINGSADVGKALVDHPHVDMVAFTGGVRAGQEIMRACADRVKKVALELSGHDPFIVCDDVELEVAVEAALWAAYVNAGQVCTSAERFYVDQSVLPSFAQALAARAGELKLGDPLDPDTDLGPLATEAQVARATDYVRRAKELGGNVLVGGEPCEDRTGYFFQPTVINGLSHEAVTELGEVFGPIAVLVGTSSFDEAIECSNDSDLGLAANVLTTDLDRGMRAAQELRFGTVWVNNPLVDNDAGPFGGYRMTGHSRELGAEGLDLFTETKHVCLDRRLEQKVWWFPYSKYSEAMGITSAG